MSSRERKKPNRFVIHDPTVDKHQLISVRVAKTSKKNKLVMERQKRKENKEGLEGINPKGKNEEKDIERCD